ncbi:MAG: 50S ribosomal protein L11 methyltransferase [Gloeobacterales cyanobacterium]
MQKNWVITAETIASSAETELEEILNWRISEFSAGRCFREVCSNRLRIIGYLDGDIKIEYIESWGINLRSQFPQATITWRQQDNEDWVEKWQKQCQPRRVGRNLLLCPPWLTPPANGLNVVQLEPGIGFGTGEHPSTRLSLIAIEQQERLGGVADIGCGSGVLSSTALLIGADYCWSVDLDLPSVRATCSNLALNNVIDRAEVKVGSTEQLHEQVDTLVCNISALVIIDLADEFVRLLKPMGTAIFSGFTEDELPKVEDALSIRGWMEQVKLCEGAWVCLIGQFCER